MKRFIAIALCALLAVLQLSFWPFVRPFGVVPNAVLVIMVLMSLEVGVVTNLTIALALGLMLDFASGSSFGLWTGTLLLVVMAGAWLQRLGIELRGLVLPAVCIVASTLIFNGIMFVSLLALAGRWSIAPFALVAVELVINLLLMIAIRPVVRWGMVRPGGG